MTLAVCGAIGGAVVIGLGVFFGMWLFDKFKEPK